MKIDDSLRNEVMPEMVYSLCRLVSYMKLTQEEIIGALSLGSNKANIKMSVSKVFAFAAKSGMIEKEDSDETWICVFNDDELASFRSFRHALFMKAAPHADARFGKVVQWYLAQDPDDIVIEKGEDLIQLLPAEIGMKDAQNARGLINWASALGIIQRKYAGSKRSMNIYPRINECISDWLYFDKPFPLKELIPVRDFMQRMKTDCLLLQKTFKDNDINRPLSNALRILDGTGWLKLVYANDSGDVWHLTKSIVHQLTNDITEIEVLR